MIVHFILVLISAMSRNQQQASCDQKNLLSEKMRIISKQPLKLNVVRNRHAASSILRPQRVIWCRVEGGWENKHHAIWRCECRWKVTFKVTEILKVYISQRLIYRKNPLLLLQNNSAESWKGIHFLYFVCNDPTATSVVRSGGNLSTVFDYFWAFVGINWLWLYIIFSKREETHLAIDEFLNRGSDDGIQCPKNH